jgi:hypothetical protein
MLQSPGLAGHAANPASDHRCAQHAATSLDHEDLGSVAPDDEDTATAIESLARVCSKDGDYAITLQQPSRLLEAQEDGDRASNLIFENSNQTSLNLLEILLPCQAQIRQLVNHHGTYLLWYHGS